MIGARRNLGLFFGLLAGLILVLGCGREDPGDSPPTLFSLMEAKQTGVDFTNHLTYTEEYNTYTYRNFYNGAGVGLGDFNRLGGPQ